MKAKNGIAFRGNNPEARGMIVQPKLVDSGC
jgi:hypothetical protein